MLHVHRMGDLSYKAGGSTDVAARTMGPFLEKYLGQPIVVLNLPGAGGQVGWTKLARSKPDGYTIGFINMPALNMVYSAREGVLYHPVKSWDPIGCNIIDPNTVMVRIDDDRFKIIQDLIEYARKNPGKVICGADGPLSDDQLAMVKIQKATGVKFSYVAYNGAAPAHAALLGKHSDFIITNTQDTIIYKDKERCLVQLWKERYHMNPNTPTFKEVFGKELIGSSTRGIVAPAGVPADRLKILRDAFKKAAHNPEYKERAKKVGLTLAWMDAEEFGQFMKNLQADVDALINELK
ncbi:MAG: tripartite tricarboxylate transporter substrate binding protein [Deltaproteobacteria bacterium]|nr:tripartite tricarboxylate transporter substrate binding protein [Deltaproteobacteria bacterium]